MLKPFNLVHYILSLFLLVLPACSRSPIDQAQSFIAIGDYKNAITILEKAITDNPKDTQLRSTLVSCFENMEDWGKALDQCKVISNIHNTLANRFRTMRLYAQLGRFDEVEMARKEFPNDSIIGLPDFKQLQEEAEKDYRKIADSLNITLDSVYFHPASAHFSKYIESRSQLLSRGLGLSDYFLAIGLVELHSGKDYLYTGSFRSALLVDSSNIRFLRKPIADYISTMVKPEPRLWSTRVFYYQMRDYHEKRAKLFEILGNLQAAIEEYSSHEYWLEADEDHKPDRTTVSIYYTPRLRLLLQTKQYDEIIKECQKLQKKYGPDPRFAFFKSEAQARLSNQATNKKK